MTAPENVIIEMRDGTRIPAEFVYDRTDEQGIRIWNLVNVRNLSLCDIRDIHVDVMPPLTSLCIDVVDLPDEP